MIPWMSHSMDLTMNTMRFEQGLEKGGGEIRDDSCLLPLSLGQAPPLCGLVPHSPSLWGLQGCSWLSQMWSGSTVGVELLKTGRLNRAGGEQAQGKANLVSVGRTK